MSRSYKLAMLKDKRPGSKTEANRRIRHMWDIADGNHYRKRTESWDICDWVWDDRYNRPSVWGRNYHKKRVNKHFKGTQPVRWYK